LKQTQQVSPSALRTLVLERGLARLLENWLHHADADLQQVLRRDPNHPAALHFLGLTKFKLGQSDDAIGLIRRALAIEPRRVLAWLDLAVALRNTGRSAAALNAYRQAIENVSATESGAEDGFDELRFDGSSSHTSFMQMLPVPASAEEVPPLEHLQFSVDRGEYCFGFLDYRYRASVRYGAGRPPHALLFDLIDSERGRYAKFVDGIAHVDLAKIPLQADYAGSEPFWLNTWFPPLDAVTLFAMMRQRKPNIFIEVGSGMSTKFARKAISTYGLGTRIISVDPKPRSKIDSLVDETVRAALEDVDPRLFCQLQADDVLFIDSSHRAFQNSDVTFSFWISCRLSTRASSCTSTTFICPTTTRRDICDVSGTSSTSLQPRCSTPQDGSSCSLLVCVPRRRTFRAIA
jgi:hypothetical protein